jgi:hypothetical protein
MATSGLLGRYGRLLSGYCASKALLSAPEEVVAAALLALTQCMAADMRFCADNVALVFTLLVQRWELVGWECRDGGEKAEKSRRMVGGQLGAVWMAMGGCEEREDSW